jgi:hypothetical protein
MIIDQPVTLCLSPQQFHAVAIRLGVDVHAHQDPCDAVLEAIANQGRTPWPHTNVERAIAAETASIETPACVKRFADSPPRHL